VAAKPAHLRRFSNALAGCVAIPGYQPVPYQVENDFVDEYLY
jgi:hypothetical protein